MERQTMDFNREQRVLKMATFKADRKRLIETDLSWLQELSDAFKEENTFLRSKKKQQQSMLCSQYKNAL
jgi:hypothetical protein